MAETKPLEWQDKPPPKGRSGYDWTGMVETLRSNPGVWAKMLTEVPVSLRVAIEGQRMTAMRLTDGRIEVRVRNSFVQEGSTRRVGDLWMRYMETGDSDE